MNSLKSTRFALPDDLRGVQMMLGAAFFFTLTASISKWLGQVFPTVELVFFRNIVGVVFILLSIYRRPLEDKGGGKMPLLIFRGVIGTLSLYMFFYAIQVLGVGRASTYQYTYPIFLAVFTWLFIGESLNIKEWGAIFIGFVGILFIFRPDLSVPVQHHALGLGNAILTALAYLSIRQLGQVYDVRAIILSFMLSGIVMPLISMLVGAYWHDNPGNFLIGTFILPITSLHWLGLLALGITALIGQKLMTQAFTYDKAGRVAAIGYSNILFATIFGIFMGEAIPTIPMLVGMAFIIIGGVIISVARGERKKKSTAL